MGKGDIILSEINHSHQRTNTIWFHLHEVPRVVKFVETKWNDCYEQLEGEEEWELVFHGYGVSVLQLEKSSGDG